MAYLGSPLCSLGEKDGETSRDTATPKPADTTRRMCAALEARASPSTSVSLSCATAPQDFRPTIGARQPQDFPRLYDFDNSTIIAYSNSITPIFMSTSNKEYFTPGNGANKESATQWIDTIGRTAANCAQNFFTVLGTERIEDKQHHEIAMKRCLCPGIPDSPTRLASATTHRNGITCVSINCRALLAVAGDFELM
jgi:hypothetical protein